MAGQTAATAAAACLARLNSLTCRALSLALPCFSHSFLIPDAKQLYAVFSESKRKSRRKTHVLEKTQNKKDAPAAFLVLEEEK